ncbi:MAG TPA: hypothetical protein VJX67_23875 [Blastocatellia bacterium]|nr:hypothetical protein [Blastocatellia bacterium]
MKRVAIAFTASLALFAVAGFGLNATRVRAQTAGAIQRQFNVSPGQRIHFDLQTGASLTINGWDNNIVSVDGALGGQDGADCRVDMQQDASGVLITSTYAGSNRNHSSDIRLDLRVPRNFNVEIESGGGNVTVSNLEGRISGQTGGGSLRITDSKGEADFRTGGGSIYVGNSSLEGKVTTGGGNVEIDVNTGNLQGSTGGGTVTYKGGSVAGLAAGARAGVARIRTGGGDIRLNDVPNGADLQTGGGTISIRSGRGHVKAQTGGGNITIGNLDGSVSASTGGGNISVTVVDQSGQTSHDVRVATGGGDVTVTLPAAISADFDIQLAYTNNARKTYQIVNDFAVSQQTSDGWSSSNGGTPRKTIYGTGTVGGGQNKIVIRTVNGNVYVRSASQ